MTTPESLEKLLERLEHADDETVGQLFEAVAPYLQMVVSRLIPGPARSKLGSEDVVLSVWVDVVQGLREDKWHFSDGAHLKAFLLTLTRNRLYDRLRQNRKAMEHEQSLSVESTEQSLSEHCPNPEEILQADEMWERLLKCCPAQFQECLHLRRQGHTYPEIAEKTGFHPSSIRRIMYDLAREVVEMQPKELQAAPRAEE